MSEAARAGRADVTVLAATWMEWRAVRRALAGRQRSGVGLVRCGIAVRRWTLPAGASPVLITCGLAGGLVGDLLPGTVVVADSVALEGGEQVACDPGWVRALVAGARELGCEPAVGPLLTARRPVVGPARGVWANRGFLAAEMETARLVPTGAPLASIRVILDAPSREMSPEWAAPGWAALDPRRGRELLWLARRAPGYARLAARCLAAGLDHAPLPSASRA